MKTTRQQQDATRRQIIASAVDLMTRQGFDGTTMKDIARAAGIGDATIYKYFPTKDRIALGYLDLVAEAALTDTLTTPGLAEYALQEKLQRLTDAVLERLLADREFVAELRAVASRAPLTLLTQPLSARERLRSAVQGFIEAAEAAGEIEPCGFQSAAAGLYLDYLAGVVTYWLADESEEFADTAQLVDLSLGVLVLVLRAGLANRLLELGSFLVRSQLARLMQRGSGLMGMLQLARKTLEASATQAHPRAQSNTCSAPPPPEPAAPTKPSRRKPRT